MVKNFKNFADSFGTSIVLNSMQSLSSLIYCMVSHYQNYTAIDFHIQKFPTYEALVIMTVHEILITWQFIAIANYTHAQLPL